MYLSVHKVLFTEWVIFRRMLWVFFALKACFPSCSLWVTKGLQRKRVKMWQDMLFPLEKHTCVLTWASKHVTEIGKNKSANEYSKQINSWLKKKKKKSMAKLHEGLWYFFLQNARCSLSTNDWEMQILTKKPRCKHCSFSFPSWAWESKTGLKNILARF